MLLTPSIAVAGLVAALLQFAAHHLMRGRRYKTPIPRYAVGSTIVCLCFAVGWIADSAQHPIPALIYVYLASFAGTWIGYELDPQPKARPSADDLDKWAAAIVGEHSEPGDGD